MARPIIVIVEKDEKYLTALEVMVVETLKDAVDVEIITEESYFEEYFTRPKTIDVLVISKEMYSEKLHMHNIDRTYILTEDLETQDKVNDVRQEVIYLYKFSNLSALVSRIIPGEWSGDVSGTKEPQIIAIVSPAGGTGCTTIAMGISACMQQNLKKALYINTENYQSFHFYLNNKSMLPMEGATILGSKAGNIYERIKQYFYKEGFTYLPPLQSSRDTFDISDVVYSDIARTAKQSKDYDFIIVDIGNNLSSEMLKFLTYADKVFVIVKQDANTAFKLGTFKRNVNCDDPDKFVMVCNCFEKNRVNVFLADNLGYNLVIDAYVEKQDEIVNAGCTAMKDMEDMQKLAYMII